MSGRLSPTGANAISSFIQLVSCFQILGRVAVAGHAGKTTLALDRVTRPMGERPLKPNRPAPALSGFMGCGKRLSPINWTKFHDVGAATVHYYATSFGRCH
jgi:hypothetical protein